jgi:DNA-binding transcriptional regulator YiaG
MRRRLGLSQEAFGQRLGVCRVTISRWERGTVSPSRMARRALERMKETTE